MCAPHFRFFLMAARWLGFRNQVLAIIGIAKFVNFQIVRSDIFTFYLEVEIHYARRAC